MYYLATVTTNNESTSDEQVFERQFDTYHEAEKWVVDNFTGPLTANIYGEDNDGYEEYNLTRDENNKIEINITKESYTD